MAQGWHGWDDYAAFYDWENARTLGRRDVGFWRDLIAREAAPALELGCGTGRLLVPMARSGMPLIGIDRSGPMLDHALRRIRRLPRRLRPGLARGDIRSLPFPAASFGTVVAAYGLLQSLLDDADLSAVLAETTRVLRPGGLLGIDLVPDLAAWEAHDRRVSMRGRSARGGRVTLIEAVRQDRRRRLTIFDEEFIERRGRRETRRRFSLTFRTVSVAGMVARLEGAGLRAEALLGDYRGSPLAEGADVWLILARKP